MLAFVERYQKFARILAELPVLEMARYQVHRLMKVAPLADVLMKAERATPTHISGEPDGSSEAGNRTHLPRAQAIALPDWRIAEQRQVLAAMKEYRETLLPERRHLLAQYRPIDVCFKVVGTGSVGTRDYCIYMEGNGPGDPLFLQIKEEVGSAYLRYLNDEPKKSHWGRLVAEGQLAMQMPIRSPAGMDDDCQSRLPGAPTKRPQGRN